MGQAKHELMKWQELGCSRVGDKKICPNCVDDYALKQFICDHALHKKCDYCNRRYRTIRCAEADTLIEHVASSISYEYEDPVHSVGYCSAEGGYLLPTMDSNDLVSHFDLGEFSSDAENSLDGLWVEKDPYGDRPWEVMLSSWDSFADHVKHRQRFFFPRTPSAKYGDDTPNASILDQIASVAEEAGLIKTLSVGTALYRSRQHAHGIAFTTAIDLGTPPADRAIFSNRMSPAGIPMFYSAKDPATAREETEIADAAKPEMSTGKFTTVANLTVLDLADLPKVPSLFDERQRHLRAGLKFIHGFAQALALPIRRNGQEHIDYVPTQMVSEYFRTVFRVPGAGMLDGLCYRSVKNSRGVCVCLFFTHEDFDGTGHHAGRVPQLQKVKRFQL